MPPIRDSLPDDWDFDDIDLPDPVLRKTSITPIAIGSVETNERGGQLAHTTATTDQEQNDDVDEDEANESLQSEVDSPEGERLDAADSVQSWSAMTRSRSGLQIESVDTSAVLPADTEEEHMVALANELQSLESPADLSLLYPPQFSTASGSDLNRPCMRESDILHEFIAMEDDACTAGANEFLEFHLHDFCVYRAPGHPRGFDGQYESLMTVASEKHQLHWLVDGTLEHNGIQRRIMGGHIIDVSIGGLQDLQEHSTKNLIWLKTLKGGARECWYRLKEPTKPYSKYWTDFVWLSTFGKHVIDYFKANTTNDISLLDFKKNFRNFLHDVHGNHIDDWLSECGFREDFRSYLLRHAQFLWNQVYSLYGLYGDDHAKLTQPIWFEIGAKCVSHKQDNDSATEKTVVTANVANAFLKTFPHWRTRFNLLQVVKPCPEVLTYRQRTLKEWNFPDKFKYEQSNHFLGDQQISKAASILENAVPGKLIRIRSIDHLLRKVVILSVKSKDTRYDLRYAWVRALSRSLKAIAIVWLALPTDTICVSKDDNTFYPIGNELFFTDECNCNEVLVKDIVQVINVSVFTDHAQDNSQLFVHCLYRKQEKVFANAVEEELICQCRIRKKNIPATMKKPPQSSKLQAATQRQTHSKLQTLSLFSGCGLLDYAFCAPGYAQTDLAIEHCEMAVRSYQANDIPKRTRCVIGSVNASLRKAMQGGEAMRYFHCLIAGCPCQGFSSLNTSKHTREGQKNCSLLANTLSWVETFMPAYVVSENVPKMDELRPNACAQAICHLVTLGYQVRKMFCRADHLGGASIRERLIIIAAAPGVILPAAIPETHGSAGSKMAVRMSSQAIDDLPDLHNDTIINIMDPDHIPLKRLRVDFRQGINFRSLVQQIPTQPSGMSLSKTYYLGGLLLPQREWFETLDDFKQAKRSTCLKRINPDEPFYTICTVISPMDAKSSGQIIHPFQDRTISVKEARRAMDVPDWFLLVGSISQQFKMLGNGVPWVLGAAIGRAVGKSWVASLSRRANGGISGPVRIEQKKKETVLGGRSGGVLVSAASLKRARRVVQDEDDEDDYKSDSSVEFIGQRPAKKIAA